MPGACLLAMGCGGGPMGGREVNALGGVARGSCLARWVWMSLAFEQLAGGGAACYRACCGSICSNGILGARGFALSG